MSTLSKTYDEASGLCYRRVQLHFMYSSVFQFGSFADAFRRLCALGKGRWLPTIPGERKGLSPSLRIASSLWAQDPPASVALLGASGDRTDAELSVMYRLCDSGAMGVTLRLCLGSGQTHPQLSDIYAALGLVRRTENGLRVGRLLDSSTGKRFTLFERFLQGLGSMVHDLKTVEAKLIDMPQPLMKLRPFEYQNPYVVTVCELGADATAGNRRPWWEDAPPWRGRRERAPVLERRWREIATILLRLVDGRDYLCDENMERVRLPGEGDLPDYDLQNYAWDSRLYMAFHARSALLLCGDLDKPPANFMLPSLLNMMEIIRSHWYTSILVNASLDRQIARIQEENAPITLDLLQSVVQLRKLWARHLNDPATYEFEGGSVTAIARAARDKMWLDHLERLTQRKFEILDKACEDQMRADRIAEYEKLRVIHGKQ